MRLKIILLLLSLTIMLGMSSLAFADNQAPPGFGAYYGEVKAADGTLVESGTVQAYLNGQAAAGGTADIKNGRYDALVVEASMASENQPIVFKVTFNGKEYPATVANEARWNFLDFEEVNLTIDAETGTTGNSSGEQGEVGITVGSNDLSLKTGDKEQINVTVSPSDAAVTYSSSSKNVAGVSSSGLVTAVGNGTAAITVTASKTGYATAVAEVNVTVSDESKVLVSVSPTSITLKSGETKQIDAKTNPAGAAVAYTSNNTGVATVNSTGLVTAVGKGTAVITATASSDGFGSGKADVSVTVSEATGDANGDVNGAGAGTGSGTNGGSAPPVQTQSFGDVPPNHWAAGVIRTLSEKGIVGGYPGGLFKPENNISRAEFIKMLTGAIGLPEDKSGAPLFSDVARSEWYFGCIQAAAKAGFSKGYDTGEFRPDAQITRQEMAVILIRAMGKENTAAAGENTSFTDDSAIASWARGFVVTAVKEKLVNGYPDNTFGPNSNASRAEACAMISSLLEKK